MTMNITKKLNGNQYYMQATGDSANDVFVATSEWAWMPNSLGVLTYQELDWAITGGGGNDKLTAGDEDDAVDGGLGNDTIYGLDGMDQLRGGEGNDVIYGGAMADTLTGDQGNDWLSGDDGNDLLIGDESYLGGGGNDTLVGGAGADTMYGGYGNDTYYVDNAGDVVQETAWGGYNNADNTGIDLVMVNLASYTLPALVENGMVDPVRTAATKIVGNTMDNNLQGGAGADTLEGGAGNDTLDGGAGSDRMVGGTGDDTYVVTSSADVVVELASQGTDFVQSHLTNYTLPANVEDIQLYAAGNANATGNALANTMTGNLYANVMYGLDGNDTIDGFLGNDSLYGNAGDDVVMGNFGNDVVFGQEGNDQLYGGAGNDILAGGPGKDTLVGGDGSDTLVYFATSESTTIAFDLIQGFVKGQDKIDLAAIDAKPTVSGNQAFAFNSFKPFFTSAGDLWLQEINGSTSVYMDVNGDGIPEMRIDVTGVLGMTASDFIL